MDENAKTIRSMVEHENELTNQRVQWMLTAQGLLFAALAFAWKDARPLISVLCMLGIVIAVATIINVYFATKAVERLITWWNAHSAGYQGPPVTGIEIKPNSILNFFSPIGFPSRSFWDG